MDCICYSSDAVTKRPEVTVQGYRRFCRQECGKQFNERNDGVLNRTFLPRDVIALVVRAVQRF